MTLARGTRPYAVSLASAAMNRDLDRFSDNMLLDEKIGETVEV